MASVRSARDARDSSRKIQFSLVSEVPEVPGTLLEKFKFLASVRNARDARDSPNKIQDLNSVKNVRYFGLQEVVARVKFTKKISNAYDVVVARVSWT